MRFHRAALGSTACLAALSVASPSHAGGSNYEHELAVYSLSQYGTYLTQQWKTSVPPWYVRMDPYEDFFELLMDNCTTSECAHTSSARFRNSAVTVDQMTTTAGSTTDRGWSSSDLVFFYGHNTQIQPQWEGEIDAWHWDTGLAQWFKYHYSDWRSWGTTANFYEYHYEGVSNASLTNPFSVFYAYNPFTSVLVGKDFSKSGTWYSENTWNGSASAHTNTLNTEVEWVVANGCNAVSVADPWGNSLALAKNAWSKSWTGTHMVLGHYAVIDTGKLPYLDEFASALMNGDFVAPAYFDAHRFTEPYDPEGTYEADWPGYAQPSAIERAPTSCCFWFNGYQICPTQGCSGDYFTSDRWEPNNMADLTTPLYYYYATTWREREPQ